MEFRKEAPVKTGFYYWQGGHLTGNQVAVVQVSAYQDKDRPLLAQELCYNGYKNAPADGPAKDWGGKWSGPLLAPSELISLGWKPPEHK